MISKKITSLDELGKISNKFRRDDKSVVLCHGMFDLIHLGHIRYFKEAKKEGDILIVTLTSDDFCRKGPDRPIFSENLRAESLAALEIIDYIKECTNNELTDKQKDVIELLKTDTYISIPKFPELDIKKKDDLFFFFSLIFNSLQ